MLFNAKTTTRKLAEAGVDFKVLLGLTKEEGKDYTELKFKRGRLAGMMVDAGLLRKKGYKAIPRSKKQKGSKTKEVSVYIPGVHFETWKEYYQNLIGMSLENPIQAQPVSA